MPFRSKAQERAAFSGALGPEMKSRAKTWAAETPNQAKLPEHVKRDVHPALKERAGMVKEAHAHLSKAIPGFNSLPMKQQMMAHQEHVRTRKGK